MTPKLFGTDGVRGHFGEPPLDRTTVTALGHSLATMLREKTKGTPTILLGGDTRESTPTLMGWLMDALTRGKVEARSCGMVPTPAVARLVVEMGADAGIVVSASHNPHRDNGIKLIDRHGFKWEEGDEAALEERMEEVSTPESPGEAAQPPPDPAMAQRYLEAVAATLPGARPLDGLKIALDTANGAASPYAGELFASLGATPEVMHASPDGTNINRQCGSTAPQELEGRMAQGRHHLGFAFDGDADRALMVDEAGTLRDGDAMLYLWACDLARRRRGPRKIVATVMSNLGLEQALIRRRIELIRCPVGDRAVVQTLRREGIHLGGEQSGHIVHMGLSTTGDGLLTAIQVAAIIASGGGSAREMLRDFHRLPQILLNTRVRRREPFDSIPRIAEAVRSVENQLQGKGRLLLRYSGTEPLARVMIEGPDQGEIQQLAEYLVGVIREALG